MSPRLDDYRAIAGPEIVREIEVISERLRGKKRFTRQFDESGRRSRRDFKPDGSALK